MFNVSFEKRYLEFKTPAGTSRGVLFEKPSWFIKLWYSANPIVVGVGECSIIPGLSYDGDNGMDEKIATLVCDINSIGGFSHVDLTEWPSIRFALESALLDLQNGGRRHLFPSPFIDGTHGIPINGLIWMGDTSQMTQQIESKIKDGYNCLKMKIGAIGFDDELAILQSLRQRFSGADLTLRVDANGAFGRHDVWDKLERLAKLDIHSIEQPIKLGQWELMRDVCARSPVSVALDEELIGVCEVSMMRELISFISPQYLILKPGLLGGFNLCDRWIALANEFSVGWWATSALEGNVGLNAIAQWTYSKDVSIPQGLGTGQLFSNNIESPLHIYKGHLFYQQNGHWAL